LSRNHLCGLYKDDGGNIQGTYTAEGITKLCEGLKGSSMTSLECAADTPTGSYFYQRPLTRLSTCLRSRARSLRRNELGPEGATALAEGLKGNSTLQSLEYATRARTRPRECLLLSQRPLTCRLSHHAPSTLPRSIAGNEIGDEGMRKIGNALLSGTPSSLRALQCDAFNVPLGAASLDLRGKKLGAASATLLAGVLKGNTTITSLE
jgi:hypothetical protein